MPASSSLQRRPGRPRKKPAAGEDTLQPLEYAPPRRAAASGDNAEMIRVPFNVSRHLHRLVHAVAALQGVSQHVIVARALTEVLPRMLNEATTERGAA